MYMGLIVQLLVPGRRFELLHLPVLVLKTSVAANFTNPAFLEESTGLEPACPFGATAFKAVCHAH